MFDLEHAISEWRKQLLAAGITSVEALDELESHLRDEIQKQRRLGVNDQRAFAVATQEIGRASTLKGEFKKIAGPSSVAELFMISVCAVFVAFIIFLSTVAVIMCFEKLEERVMASTAMACSLVVAGAWKRGVPFLPVIASRGWRMLMPLMGMSCGFAASGFFCNFILPHFEGSPDHQIPAIGFWAVFLIAVFTCAGLGLGMSQSDREHLGVAQRRFASPLNL